MVRHVREGRRRTRHRSLSILLGLGLVPFTCWAGDLVVPKYGSAADPPLVIGLLSLGVLIGLLAYNLFLAISTRERMFAYFSVIVLLLSILQTFSTYERLIISLTYNRVTLVTHLLFMTFLVFFEDFFRLSDHRPRLSALNRLSIWVIAGYTLFFLIAKVIFPSAADLRTVLDFIRELFVFYTNALFLATIAAAIGWMRTEATLMLVAFVPPAVLTSVNAMSIFPFMARYGDLVSFLMQYNQPIGLSLQAILFSLAMGNRYNRLKLERESSRQESERLRRLDEEKTEFFMNMSHETRTPLTIILGTTRQLRQGRFGDSIRRNDRSLAAIERNSLRLLRQVTRMLRLGRPTAPTAVREIPLGPAVRMMVDEFSAVAAQRMISLGLALAEGTESIALVMAGEDLEAVVMNLVSNAVKYTPPEGTVTISTQLCDAGRLRLSVSDTGPGIAREHADEVFQRYRSLPAGAGQPQTGLGLSLVKSIMESYGGRVELRSEPGSGSVFALEFPSSVLRDRVADTAAVPVLSGLGALYSAELSVPSEVPVTAPLQEQTDSKAPLVLVVEDDPDMRAYVTSALVDRYRVLAVGSGREGLAALQAQAVDLIISDVMMPEMDGHAFLGAVRRQAGAISTPLIFLTARDSMEERIDALREGAVRYITKPFSPEMLSASIDAILRHDRELVESRVRQLRGGIEALLQQVERPAADPKARLTPADARRFCVDHGLSARESEIVELMIEGRCDKDIAATLHLSPRTIANHNRRIYRKTGVGSRFELVSKVYGGSARPG